MSHRRPQAAPGGDSRFLAAADTSPDAICILEADRNDDGGIRDLRVTYANGAADRLSPGLSAGTTSHLFPRSNGIPNTPGMFHRICHVIATGEPLVEEVETDDPHVLADWVRYRAVRLGEGAAVTLIDISGQKSAEHRMRELAAFTESIFENAPFSIIATDADGLITAMNDAAENITR